MEKGRKTGRQEGRKERGKGREEGRTVGREEGGKERKKRTYNEFWIIHDMTWKEGRKEVKERRK